jgi:phosphopantothenoylcysteine decarboxylase / phosphopantothenate---cysteine ligase
MNTRSNRRIHPSKNIAGSAGSEVRGKKIVLCITGSVAAYRAIDLARLLMRHGAEVYPVMSKSSSVMLLSPEMMKWATGNEAVTELTGDLEHIGLADYNMSDLIIVYPCTANTISKMACGIDDTPVTSVLSVAAGSRIPIIICPAMHIAMYYNEFIKHNMGKLKSSGIQFVEPSVSEGKAKVADPQVVLDLALRIFDIQDTSLSSSSSLLGKNILVTAGSTIEYIDPVRIVTNLSSGKMGKAIVEQAKSLGAEVTLVYGHSTSGFTNLPGVRCFEVNTGEEMYNIVASELSSRNYDIAIFCAAISDFKPHKKLSKKIKTTAGKFVLQLSPTKKIVDAAKKISKKNLFLVAFKAEYKVSDSYLISKATEKLKECNGDLIVANDIGRRGSNIGSDNNEVIVVNREKEIFRLPLQDKNKVANSILQLVVRSLPTNMK